MAKKSNLKHSFLTEVLDYDPLSGDFTWKRTLSSSGPKGSKAGREKNEYWYVGLNGREYRAHILAWFYMFKEWPKLPLDHENQVKTDNWINNLRLATGSQNNANTRRSKRNTSGYKGVSASGQKWRSAIVVNGETIRLGTFADIQDARRAYREAAIKYFGEFAYYD